MIRCYLGALLLAVLLALGIYSGNRLTDHREQVLSQARQALEAAEAEDWSRAKAAADRAREIWEEGRTFNAVLSDHGVLEKIDDAFGELDLSRNPADYSRLCRDLEILTREQQASLENIF